MSSANGDRIAAEVIRGGLETVALEMRTAIMRTAYSPIVAMGGDLSVSIGDRAGRLVAQGKDIPAQLGAMPYSFRLMLDPWRDELGPGDVRRRQRPLPRWLEPHQRRLHDHARRTLTRPISVTSRRGSTGPTSVAGRPEASTRAWPTCTGRACGFRRCGCIATTNPSARSGI